MSTFEKYLTVWVAVCIVLGIALGHFMPALFQAIGSAEIASVNLPVAILIWLMIIPMLIRIDLGALAGVTQHWRGISVTLVANWLVKLAFHWLAVSSIASGSTGGQLHRGADPSWRCSMHRHGLRLEQPDER